MLGTHVLVDWCLCRLRTLVDKASRSMYLDYLLIAYVSYNAHLCIYGSNLEIPTCLMLLSEHNTQTSREGG